MGSCRAATFSIAPAAAAWSPAWSSTFAASASALELGVVFASSRTRATSAGRLFSPDSSSAQVMYASDTSWSSTRTCSARRLRSKPPLPSRCLSSQARVLATIAWSTLRTFAMSLKCKSP